MPYQLNQDAAYDNWVDNMYDTFVSCKDAGLMSRATIYRDFLRWYNDGMPA